MSASPAVEASADHSTSFSSSDGIDPLPWAAVLHPSRAEFDIEGQLVTLVLPLPLSLAHARPEILVAPLSLPSHAVSLAPLSTATALAHLDSYLNQRDRVEADVWVHLQFSLLPTRADKESVAASSGSISSYFPATSSSLSSTSSQSPGAAGLLRWPWPAPTVKFIHRTGPLSLAFVDELNAQLPAWDDAPCLSQFLPLLRRRVEKLALPRAAKPIIPPGDRHLLFKQTVISMLYQLPQVRMLEHNSSGKCFKFATCQGISLKASALMFVELSLPKEPAVKNICVISIISFGSPKAVSSLSLEVGEMIDEDEIESACAHVRYACVIVCGVSMG